MEDPRNNTSEKYFCPANEKKLYNNFAESINREDQDDKRINTKIKLQYGINNENKVVHISELSNNQRGLKCKCTCPLCGSPLQARLGSGKRQPHFSHNKSECDLRIAQETALHRLAKEILEETMYLKIPGYCYSGKEELYDYQILDDETKDKLYQTYEFSDSKFVKFEGVILEKRFGNIIPDLIVTVKGEQLIIEIAVTHFVDEEKLNKIKKLNTSTLEIDLRKNRSREFSRTEFKEMLIFEVYNKKWIHNKRYVEKVSKLKEDNEKIYKKCLKKHIEAEKRRLATEEKKAEMKRQEEKDYKSKNAQILIESEIDQIRYQMTEQALKKEHYEKIIKGLRDEEKVLAYLKTTLFFKENNNEIPFFVDIPITGEIAFKSDRIIWQAAIFEEFIYNQNHDSDKTKNIKSTKVWEWVKNDQNIFEINWELNPKMGERVSGKCDFNTLAEKSLRQYAHYLAFLGFFHCENNSNENIWKNIKSKTVDPPNIANTKILLEILNKNSKINSKINLLIDKKIVKNSITIIPKCGNLYQIEGK